MNVSDMFTVLNNHGFEDTDETQKLVDINDTIWDIESREPWPFLIKSVNLNFDGTNPYPSNLPADFKRVKWITDLTTGDPVWPERIETIRERYGASLTQQDVPAYFYFVGQQLRFWPVPPASTGRYLLDYRAWQQPVTSATVEANILLPPRYHKLVVIGALERLYNMDDDPELASVKHGELEQRIANMRMDLFVQQEMRADRMVITDPDEMINDIPYWIP